MNGPIRLINQMIHLSLRKYDITLFMYEIQLVRLYGVFIKDRLQRAYVKCHKAWLTRSCYHQITFHQFLYFHSQIVDPPKKQMNGSRFHPLLHPQHGS